VRPSLKILFILCKRRKSFKVKRKFRFLLAKIMLKKLSNLCTRSTSSNSQSFLVTTHGNLNERFTRDSFTHTQYTNTLKLYTVDMEPLQNRLFIKAMPDLFFTLFSNGFLFLTNALPIRLISMEQPHSYKIKKIKYSFFFKNDLPNHILQKYNFSKTVLAAEQFVQRQASYHAQTLAGPFLFDQSFDQYLTSFLDVSSHINSVAYRLLAAGPTALFNFYERNRDLAYTPHYTIFRHKFKPGYMRY
jgi:hypothetical protein